MYKTIKVRRQKVGEEEGAENKNKATKNNRKIKQQQRHQQRKNVNNNSFIFLLFVFHDAHVSTKALVTQGCLSDGACQRSPRSSFLSLLWVKILSVTRHGKVPSRLQLWLPVFCKAHLRPTNHSDPYSPTRKLPPSLSPDKMLTNSFMLSNPDKGLNKKMLKPETWRSYKENKGIAKTLKIYLRVVVTRES